MGVIADLLVKVGSDVGSFKTGMAEVSTGVGEAEGKLGKLGAVAGPVGLALAGAATAVGVFAIHALDQATAAGNAAYEMSEKFGLTGEAASGFISVGNQLGISSEQIAKGFQFLSKNATALQLTLDATGKISASTAQPYKELGIDVLDSGGKVKSANELMLEAADRFKALPDGPNKAALAMKLFGKSGTDLLPVLNQGRAGIEAMIATGKQMGDVMGNEQVDAAHKLFLEQKQLDTVTRGFTTQVGTALIPIALALATFLTNRVAPAVQQLSAYFRDHLLPAAQQIWAFFSNLLNPMLTYIAAHFDQIKPILMGTAIAFGIVAGVVIVVIGVIVLAVVGLVAGIIWLVNTVNPKMQEFRQSIINGVQGGMTWLQNLENWVSSAPGRFLSYAVGIGTSIWHGILQGVNAAGSAIMNAIKNLLPGGANGPVVGALHAAGVPGFQFGGIVPGPYYGAPVLIQAHAGERYLGLGSGAQSAPGGSGGDINVTNHFHQVMAAAEDVTREVGWEMLKARRRR